MRRLRIGINGFGRVGRLALRAAWAWSDVEFVHVNELKGDAATGAHLLCFDSVHGRWRHEAHGEGQQLTIDGQAIPFTACREPGAVDWDVDVVLECSGKFRTVTSLEPYLERGARKVIVAAPVRTIGRPVAEVNERLRSAADGPLAGILGFETRPLVSVDYKDDARSGIVDALSTMVTDHTQVKVLAWYDNEWATPTG